MTNSGMLVEGEANRKGELYGKWLKSMETNEQNFKFEWMDRILESSGEWKAR